MPKKRDIDGKAVLMFEQRVYEMLELRMMTLQDLAKECGLTKENIHYILKHTERYRMSSLRRIAKALGCTVGWLLRDRI